MESSFIALDGELSPRGMCSVAERQQLQRSSDPSMAGHIQHRWRDRDSQKVSWNVMCLLILALRSPLMRSDRHGEILAYLQGFIHPDHLKLHF